MKQRAEIIFEREETITLRKSSDLIDSFCSACRMVVVMATPEAISMICHVGEREIFRKIDLGAVHFIEGPKVYVCLNSMGVLKEQHFIDIEGGKHEVGK